MDDHRDIYTKPAAEPAPRQGEKAPSADIRRPSRPPHSMTLVLALIMLALLGGAIWFLTLQDRQSRPPETPASSESSKPTDTFTRLPGVSDLSRDAAEPATPSRLLQRRAAATVTSAVPMAARTPPPAALTTAESATLTAEQSAEVTRELRMSQQYLQAQDLDKAEVHAQRALEIAPKLQYGLRMLGLVYVQRGQFEQAIPLLEQALAQNPLSVETLNTLGTAYMQRGMLDKAEEYYTQTEMINPDYWVAFLNLGLLNLLKGRYDVAADYLERAVQRVPDDPNPRNNLAVALIRLGRYDESRRHLQHIIDRDPSKPGPYFNLSISYVLEQNFDEAMAWIRRGAEHCSPVVCQRYLADSDFNSMRKNPAFQQFVRDLYPEVPPPPQP